MEKFNYTVTDESGVHARPAGMIVAAAKKFSSKITVEFAEKKADAKKLFALMQLGIRCGEEIVITADGEDEKTAISEIEAAIKKAGL